MAINVDHGVGAGAFVAAAFGGAQGKERADLKKKQLDAMEKRNEASRQRAHQASQASKSRKFSAEQAELGREFQTERDQWGNQVDEAKAKWMQQAEMDAYEGKLDIGQKKEWNKWENTISEIQNNPDLTEEDKADMIGQAQAKQYGIQPSHKMEETSYPKGQGVGDIWFDETTGQMITREGGDKGVSAFGNLPKQINDDLKIASEMFKDPATGMTDPVAVDKWMSEKHGDRYKRGQGGAAQQTAPLAPVPGMELPVGGIPSEQQQQAAPQQQTVNQRFPISVGPDGTMTLGTSPGQQAAQPQEMPPEQVAQALQDQGVQKPESVAADPRASRNWDVVGKQVLAIDQQVQSIKGDPAREIDFSQPVDGISDLSTARRRLEHEQDQMKQLEATYSKESKEKGPELAGHYSDDFSKFDKAKQEHKKNQKLLKARIDELTENFEMVMGQKDIRTELLKKNKVGS